MSIDAYAEVLRKNGMEDMAIQRQLDAVSAFENWLSGQGVTVETAGEQEARRYAEYIIGTPKNTLETYDALCEYTAFRGRRSLYVAFTEITDCFGAMEMLRDTIQRRHGAEIRDRIFAEPIPPLGTDEATRLKHTKQISERMNALLTPKEAHAAWFQVQHGLPKAFWERYDEKQKETFGACGTPEALVKALTEERSTMLKRLHDENRLWYTQEITNDALEYLLVNPYLRMGEHNGRKGVVVTKVPYQTEKALHAENETMRRYYTCHCPLIREAIKNGETLSDDVCYCSLGHASHYLAAIGLDGLEGEVIESAVKGDARCKFIFYLPEEN